jgi:formylglycine-generating enzyme
VTRKKWFVLLAFAAQTAGCSGEATPRPEWLVTVSTDAPLPQFGDRLLVETLTDDGQLACADCRRVLAAASPADFPVSFSVVPNGKRLLLRTRLYRSSSVALDGLPQTSFLIDHLGVLPETTTRRELSVRLSLACFGAAVDWGAQQTCAADTAQLEPVAELRGPEGPPLVAGSSPLALGRDCAAGAPEGMRCLPGGLFVLGDEAVLQISPDSDPRPERLVRLSAFFLDEDEFTVGQLRQLIRERRVPSEPTSPDLQIARTSTCTYAGAEEPKNDAYPVTCLTRDLADEACTALGKRLPTESEWEYAAGNMTRETAFPWGSDNNVCQYAVLGRAALSKRFDFGGDNTCLGEATVSALTAPVAAGQPLDITDQGVRNLAGNVTEIVADRFAPYGSGCWSSPGVLENPRCDEGASSAFAYALRGGSWGGAPLYALVARRTGEGNGLERDPTVGFRCAQSAE